MVTTEELRMIEAVKEHTQTTEQSTACAVHAKHISYQIRALASSIETDLQLRTPESEANSLGAGKYLTAVADLIDQNFTRSSKSTHAALLQELDKFNAFVKMQRISQHDLQQISECFYDLKLLMAMSQPVNTLKQGSSAVIFTSSQHQFDVFSLVAHINENNGAFINPETKLLFQKKDVQLIKLAAEKQKLKLASQDTTFEQGQMFFKKIGISPDLKLTVASRYDAESSRSFNPERIYQAVLKAFLDVSKSQDIKEYEEEYFVKVEQVTARVATMSIELEQKQPSALTVERIQGFVESALMELGFHEVARSYVLYRDEKARVRQNRLKQLQLQNLFHPQVHSITVTMPSGEKVGFTKGRMAQFLMSVFKGNEHLNQDEVLDSWYRSLFSGIGYVEFIDAAIMSCRTLIEVHPDYSFVAARILKKKMLDEALESLGIAVPGFSEVDYKYAGDFKTFLEKGIACGMINPKLAEFDLDRLMAVIDENKDRRFHYLGLQTLYDRYFLHDNGVRYELPQHFFMRVAMGLCLDEQDKEEKAIAFYKQLSNFDYMSATATLFNSGLVHSQLSSCYLTTVPDDLHGIFASLQDNAMLSKFAGGLGNDWTQVRGNKSKIKGTNGESSGIIPFLNVADATTIAVNQGGKRKGAVCAYLETWHIDILDFLELRKNTGDDRRRTHDMNTANWIPDLFMQRVMQKGSWTLFSPDQAPDLHGCYGKEFKKKYEHYEQIAEKGLIESKTIDAVVLWRKMLSMVFETGHPWFTFKDPCNIRSPQQHCGTVHSSNLCTEITLNTSKDEIAVCNLGSINLAQHVSDAGIDTEKLKATVRTAIRMLDNVIDINYYAVEQARNSNIKHRPIGLGMMGFQDALYAQNIAYESEEAVEFADELMEHISYYAIEASSDLAKERGSYESYQGSLWSQGILPIDSIALLKESRGGEYLEQDQNSKLDWKALRAKISKQGMRNSNVMAIAPTATISNICGITQSIEPTYKNLFVKSNLSGEFTVINPHLVHALEKEGLWDEKMVRALKLSNGSVQAISDIPDRIKACYKTAFELDPLYLIRSASMRAKWIDQSQSLNLYMAKASGKKLDKLYKDAWLHGLKTTYYLRSLGATDSEKSSVEERSLNAVAPASTPQACSIDNPDCEACQ